MYSVPLEIEYEDASDERPRKRVRRVTNMGEGVYRENGQGWVGRERGEGGGRGPLYIYEGLSK